jgi:ribonuclease P protein component
MQADVRRLKTAAQFQVVLQAKPQRRSAHFAMHGTRRAGSHFRADDDVGLGTISPWSVGVVVPKRWAKRAVTRNLIKRQMYAVFNERYAALPPGVYVFRLCAGFAPQGFVSARSAALAALVRSELLGLLDLPKPPVP